MKNLVLIAFILLGFSFNLFAERESPSPQKGYNIQIRVKGLKDTICCLAYRYGKNIYAKDTSRIDGTGLITFKGNELLPTGLYIAILPGDEQLPFIVKEQSFSLQTDTSDYVKHMKVKNSIENTLWFEYLNFREAKHKELVNASEKLKKTSTKKDSIDSRSKILVVDQQVKDYIHNMINENTGTFVATFLKAMEEPEIPAPPKDANGKIDSSFSFNYYKTHFWDNIDFTEDGLVRTQIFHNKLEEYIEKLTYKIPDSLIKAADIVVEKSKQNKELFHYTVWYLTSTSETSKLMGTDAVFVHMIDKYYSNKQAFWVDSARLTKIRERANILRPLLIGKKAPELRYLQDTSGAYKSFYTIQAKYIIQIFYDPECGHCQKTIPKLHEYYLKNKTSKNLEVYAVTTIHDEAGKHDKEEIWKKFIKKNELTWTNVHDAGPYYNFYKTYDITTVPVIYILNEKKEIIAKKLDVDQLDDFLMRYKE